MIKKILVIIIAMLFINIPVFSVKAEQQSLKKTVVIIVDYTTLEDLTECSFIEYLASQSYLGFVNNRQPGKANQYTAKLIFGAGKRLEADSSIMESQRVLYNENGAGRRSILVADVQKLKDNITNSEYSKYVGYLGDRIIRNNGVTCIIGNSDTDKPNKSSVFTIMDSSGFISCGEVDDVIMADESFPYGIRSDYKRLAELYKQFLPASSLIIIDTGDMERLESCRNSIDRETFELYRTEVLEEIDKLTADIYNNRGFDNLIIMSTFPSDVNYKNNDRLTPIIVYDGKGKGILYSGSTRRKGIILNANIAEYILYKLGISNKTNVSEIQKDQTLNILQQMNTEIVGVSRLRLTVLPNYTGFLILSLILLLFLLVYVKEKRKNPIRRIIRIVSYINLLMPLVFLYMPLFKIFNPALFIIIAFLLSLVLSCTVDSLIKNGLKKLFIINFLLISALCIDLLLGSPMIKQSVLGYDAIIGARFYGIGNEYAGVFIGCSIVLLGSIVQLNGTPRRKVPVLIFIIFCATFLGFTMLGANFGGLMAGLVGYILVFYLIYGIQFNCKRVAITLSLISLTVVILFTFEITGIAATSHFGSLLGDIKENGIQVLLSTVKRKIGMNIRLIKYTIWTRVLFFIILTIAFMFYRPIKILDTIFCRYEYMKYSWIAVSTASVAGFFANDSGIVMAAIAMIYVVFTMLSLCADIIDSI